MFNLPYNTLLVITGCAFLGFASGLVGSFSLLRKRTLLCDALAHASLPGICGAFLITLALGIPGKSLVALLIGAFFSAALGIATVQTIIKNTRIVEESAIAIVLGSFFGFGVLLLSIIQNTSSGAAAGINHFIYGQAASMVAFDVKVILVLATLSIVMTVLLFKELTLVAFDDSFAGSLGWPVNLLDLALMFLILMTTVIGLQAVGVIMVVALLVTPPTTARLWTDSTLKMVLLSSIFGALSSIAGGYYSSLYPDLPTGAVIVLSSAIIFAFSLIFAPRKGILASIFRTVNLKFKVYEDHILREGLEVLHSNLSREPLRYSEIENFVSENLSLLKSTPIKVSDIEIFANKSRLFKKITIHKAKLKGLVIPSSNSGQYSITNSGAKLATALLKIHVLWEIFIKQNSNLEVNHIHTSADYAEHALTSSIDEKQKFINQVEAIVLQGTNDNDPIAVEVQ